MVTDIGDEPPEEEMAVDESPASEFVLPEGAGLNFSFAGCGFMGVYHVGVCSCLKEYAPQLYEGRVLAGASAGSLAACCLLCDCDLGQCANFVLDLVKKASLRTLGPFHPSFSITSLLKAGLEEILPANAHDICSGRLYVSVTDVLSLRNRVISDFPSRDYLIQSLLCSAHIPGFSGLTFPELNGVRLMDGCFSCNLPRLNSQTVLVSPFAGLADISPEDDVWFLLPQASSVDMDLTLANSRRLLRVLWPPGPDRLAQICQRGFDDCMDYLIRHQVLRLSATSLSFSYDSFEEDLKAYEMQAQLAEGLQNSLPPGVLDALERMKRKTLMRRLYDSQMIRVIRLLIQPYTLPIDMMYLLCKRLLYYLPSMPEHAQSLLGETRHHLRSFTQGVRMRRATSAAAFPFLQRRTGSRQATQRQQAAGMHAHSLGDLREMLSDELDYRLGEEEAHDTFEQAAAVHQQRKERVVSFYLEEGGSD